MNRGLLERFAKPDIDAQAANGSKVRTAAIHTRKMLRTARTAGLVKLRRSIGVVGEGRLWAGRYTFGDRGRGSASKKTVVGGTG